MLFQMLTKRLVIENKNLIKVILAIWPVFLVCCYKMIEILVDEDGRNYGEDHVVLQ